ncbi:MAG TPA: ATP-binding cassette domain-containing protein [Candidatus Acidoferrales bacterium]|nr:ATP-binding cassette domain-containing protein [Candidatus Acidoferrales bacterium]
MKMAPLVEIRQLSHQYRAHGRSARQAHIVSSLHEIDLEIQASSTIALVGGSGSGKSTLAKCIARVEHPASGEIYFERENVWELNGNALNSFRRQVRLIYQDSSTSLNPRFTSEAVVAEPLVIEGKSNKQERRKQALAQMLRVGLPVELAERHPLELSGGQRQRLAIARALVLKPKLLILDEALAGLDLLVQKQIVEMLRSLQSENSLTYLFITHDLALAEELADEIVVLHEGRIVERARPADLFTFPRHEYTRRLVDSALLLESVAANVKG